MFDAGHCLVQKKPRYLTVHIYSRAVGCRRRVAQRREVTMINNQKAAVLLHTGQMLVRRWTPFCACRWCEFGCSRCQTKTKKMIYHADMTFPIKDSVSHLEERRSTWVHTKDRNIGGMHSICRLALLWCSEATRQTNEKPHL